MRFEAVGEALASGQDVTPACSVAGRVLAEDGASLDEALSGLAAAYAVATGGAPGFEEARALAVAWSETSLRYLHQISCADPLTGLTSLAHLRTRLGELYREAELTGSRVRSSHALVVVELVSDPEPWTVTQRLTRTLRLATLAEAVRHVFPGEETLGRLGLDRAVVLTRRGDHLGRSVATLEQYLADRELGARARVWIEGLPDSDEAVAQLLDDLARG
jgi:GGDEF domain-containing protein